MDKKIIFLICSLLVIGLFAGSASAFNFNIYTPLSPNSSEGEEIMGPPWPTYVKPFQENVRNEETGEMEKIWTCGEFAEPRGDKTIVDKDTECKCIQAGGRSDNWIDQLIYKSEKLGESCSSAIANCENPMYSMHCAGTFTEDGKCDCITSGYQTGYYGHRCILGGYDAPASAVAKCDVMREICYKFYAGHDYTRWGSGNREKMKECAQGFNDCLTAKEQKEEGEKDHCSNSILDGDEEFADCGGSCAACEWVVEISPKEVEMTADGETEIEFTVTITVNSQPVSDEAVDFRIHDYQNMVDDDSEGEVEQHSTATDSEGIVKFTYKTAIQPADFQEADLTFQAVHLHGNPVAVIHLKQIEVICGNWICEGNETHETCPADCARDITSEQARQMIISKYKSKVKLNPDLPGLLNIPIKGAITNFFGVGGEEYVCGAFQGRILAIFDGMRFSKDATERKAMEYWDYGPVETLFGFHQAVVLYLKKDSWYDSGTVLDPWFQNIHGMYNIANWRRLTGGESSPSTSRSDYGDSAYPMFGNPYRNPKGYALTAEEKAFMKTLPEETRNKLRKVSDFTRKHYIVTQMQKQETKGYVKILVASPLNLLITDTVSGLKIGIDSEGNNVSTLLDAKGGLLKASEDALSYVKLFELPGGRDYNVEFFGTGNGLADIVKLFPQETDGTYEYYEYKDIPVKSGDKMEMNLSSNSQEAPIKSETGEIVPEKKSIDIPIVAIDSVSYFEEVAGSQPIGQKTGVQDDDDDAFVGLIGVLFAVAMLVGIVVVVGGAGLVVIYFVRKRK